MSLDRDAAAIVEQFGEVTISLDGHSAALYEQIRGVNGLGAIERGVRKIKTLSPRTPIRARSTLHRHNFTELPSLIDKAHAMGLDGISFLSADVTSEGFGRRATSSMGGLLLDQEEILQFARVVEATIVSHHADFESRFVAESPDKLRRLPRYYAAAATGLANFHRAVQRAGWRARWWKRTARCVPAISTMLWATFAKRACASCWRMRWWRFDRD